MYERIWKKIIRREAFSLWAIPALILWLVSLVYRLGFYIKKRTARTEVKLPVPVISIGNIAIGGTGKTTIVWSLAEVLLAERLRVGIVSSGYGRPSKKAVVDDGYRIKRRDVSETGDEVMFLAEKVPEAIFSIHPVKATAALNLVREHEVDLVIVDDGFQHFALHRDVDIVTYDAGVKKRLLKPFPLGVLREPLRALRRADIVIITRSNFAVDINALRQRLGRVNPRADVFHAQFVPDELVGKDRRLQVKYLEDKSVFLFAGIGNFRALERQVSAMAVDVDTALELSDHQVYDRELLEHIKNMADEQESDVILTTGKDWVKLGDFDFGREIYYLTQTIDLDPGEEKLVSNLMTKLKLGSKVL